MTISIQQLALLKSHMGFLSLLSGEKFDQELVVKASEEADIGKKGSPSMSDEQQKLVQKMYKIDNVGAINKGKENEIPFMKMTVEDFFKNRFAQEYELSEKAVQNLILVFSEIESWVDFRKPSEILLVDFYSHSHVHWTYDWLMKIRTPRELTLGEKLFRVKLPEMEDQKFVLGAIAHHLTEEVNPFGVISEDGTFEGEVLSLDEALVIVYDKYDAFRNRSKMSHEKTIGILKSQFEKWESNLKKNLSDEKTQDFLKHLKTAVELCGLLRDFSEEYYAQLNALNWAKNNSKFFWLLIATKFDLKQIDLEEEILKDLAKICFSYFCSAKAMGNGLDPELDSMLLRVAKAGGATK